MTTQNQTNADASKLITLLLSRTGGESGADIEELIEILAENAAVVEDGYLLYDDKGLMRAALLINIDMFGSRLPMLFHSDTGEHFSPQGVLLKNTHHVALGSFEDYICKDENNYYYHLIGDMIDAAHGGLPLIQAIEFSKSSGIPYTDELGLRRAAKMAIELQLHQEISGQRGPHHTVEFPAPKKV